MDASYGIASRKTRTTRRQVLKDKKKSLEQLQITMQQKMFLDVFRCIMITYWCILLWRLKSNKKKTCVPTYLVKMISFILLWKLFVFASCACSIPWHFADWSSSCPSTVSNIEEFPKCSIYIPLSLLILFKSVSGSLNIGPYFVRNAKSIGF